MVERGDHLVKSGSLSQYFHYIGEPFPEPLLLIHLPAAIHLPSFNLSHSQGVRPFSFSRHSRLFHQLRGQDTVQLSQSWLLNRMEMVHSQRCEPCQLFVEQQSLLPETSHRCHERKTVILAGNSSFAIGQWASVRRFSQRPTACSNF